MGVWGFSELFFMKEPQDVTVTRKDPVFLDCQAHGEGPVKVTWLKNGAKLSESKRIQVLSNGSLYIREVEGRRGEHSDEGFYQCLAVNKYGAILSQKAHLTLSRIKSGWEKWKAKWWKLEALGSDLIAGCVLLPFEILLEEWGRGNQCSPRQPQRRPAVVLDLELSADLQCRDLELSADLQYQDLELSAALQCWDRLFKPQINISTDVRPSGGSSVETPFQFILRVTALPSGVLQIYDAGPEDAGNYRCVAATIAHKPNESRTFYMPTIVAGPQNVTVSLHQTAVLECMATGYPKPIISWSRLDHKSIDVFNTRVLGNGNLIISDVKQQHTGVKLVINQIIPEDDAFYQCMAENSQGSALSRARLTVVMSEDRPSAPYNVHAETMSSSAILLAWERPLYNSDKTK
ncbi:hypothetical protein U0070_026892 [Myodes glareolus]|uniref:Ig-like domain-containing protein n=1 Tax=Myodes glareolus TaxID=447135 RepID=A0AAW0K2N4_MYOGA